MTSSTNLEGLLYNDIVILTITPDLGDEIYELKVNNIVVEAVDNEYIFNIETNVVVTVTFKKIPIYYSLTLGEYLSAYSISDFNQVLEDTLVYVSIDIPKGYYIFEFTVNGNVIENMTGKTLYIFNINENTTINVIAKEILPAYRINLNPALGSIQADQPDISTIEKDTIVTLTIVEEERKYVRAIRFNNVDITDLFVDGIYQFEMLENVAISVIRLVTFYQIEVPDNVSSSVGLEDIPRVIEVTLTVSVPEGNYVEFFKVNGVDVDLIDNQHSFKIYEDIEVEIQYNIE